MLGKFLKSTFNVHKASSARRQAELHFAAKVLSHLKTAKHPLMLSFEGEEEEWACPLIAIDLKSEILYLNVVNDQKVDERIQNRELINLSSSDLENPIGFQTRANKLIEHKGSKYFEIPLPETFDYTPRRSSFRVKIPNGYPFHVTLGHPHKHPYNCGVIDISALGLRALLKTKNAPTVSDIYRICTIRPPDGPSVDCALEVKHVEPGPEDNTYIVGGCFRHLTPEIEREINRVVTYLQSAVRKHLMDD
jgi:c-di-GMP-binding flagellar brake protein YcgR